MARGDSCIPPAPAHLAAPAFPSANRAAARPRYDNGHRASASNRDPRAHPLNAFPPKPFAPAILVRASRLGPGFYFVTSAFGHGT